MSAAVEAREPHADDWHPHAGPQTRFLRLTCFEALYGGAAGGGKSDALLVDAIRYVGRGYGRGYLALLLRRTFPELESSLIRRSHELYPRLGGVWNEQKKTWTFPEGETVMFGHVEHELDVHRYQGSEFQFVGFDELTTFTEYQYTYLFSRVRSSHGVPCRVRAASNPGGIGHAWVRKRWFDWVSRKSKKPAKPAVVRYYAKRGDTETQVSKSAVDASGRTFVPAMLADNPTLTKNDPSYASRLDALNVLERARLKGGDWDAEPSAKDYWDRARCGRLHSRPANMEVIARVRAWDFGATANPNADATAGVLLARLFNGRTVVEHVEHVRLGPDGVDATVERTANADRERDPRTVQAIPQDPGAAGKVSVRDMQRLLAKHPIRVVIPTGDKATRFKPLASRCLAGFVDIVEDETWDHEGFHSELEAFPAGSHDDRVDGAADAYNALFQGSVPGVIAAQLAFGEFGRRS